MEDEGSHTVITECDCHIRSPPSGMRSRSNSVVGVDTVACDDREKGLDIAEIDDVYIDFVNLVEKDAVLERGCCRRCLKRTICSCTLPCCGEKKTCGFTFVNLLLIILPIFLMIFFGIFSILPVGYIHRKIMPLSRAQPSAIANSPTRILLYGDSQWGIVERLHHITDKITDYLPMYPMEFNTIGDLAVRAYNLNDRFHKYVYLRPQVVLINLDSDVSNVNEDVLNYNQKMHLRALYRANISEVVEKWLDTGAFVALGGPGLLGEGPIRPLNIPRFINKEVMLNAYVQINKEVARQYNITYFDVRSKLRKALPWYRLYYNGYLTKDGEHPNERGTIIEAKLVATVLLSMFESRTQWNEIKNVTGVPGPGGGGGAWGSHGSNYKGSHSTLLTEEPENL